VGGETAQCAFATSGRGLVLCPAMAGDSGLARSAGRISHRANVLSRTAQHGSTLIPFPAIDELGGTPITGGSVTSVRRRIVGRTRMGDRRLRIGRVAWTWQEAAHRNRPEVRSRPEPAQNRMAGWLCRAPWRS
jgi:hypothetical protein